MNAPTTLTLAGDLSIVDAAALREQLREALSNSTGDLTLNLAGVESCDSAGVQLLLSLRRSLAARGGALHIAQPAESVRQALASLGLQDLLGASAGATA
ncbi:MAG: STAS domain-containing protein [Burkholderiales bacterium]|nr:STAS domain-containing protein [Burkholderiales bacterium]